MILFTHTHMKYFLLSITLFLCAPALVSTTVEPLVPQAIAAAKFTGGGLDAGIQKGRDVQGVSNRSLRETIINILTNVLDFVGVLAAVAVILSGLFYIVSLGNEQTKEKAKNILMYTVIGLLIILFARGIVTFITDLA
ncbi:hypothetical protein COW95_00130 [Candidatus Peregrinibacteria bacterium CG22_combo_CG10-13_8_21_14_all_49_11]|nr:MAG: hypothetical protein COW95_00130 [Candidatus Peregrinibacteria bacterium CG22_combo_CG10-13_8_21_14_all_49_11]